MCAHANFILRTERQKFHLIFSVGDPYKKVRKKPSYSFLDKIIVLVQMWGKLPSCIKLHFPHEAYDILMNLNKIAKIVWNADPLGSCSLDLNEDGEPQS